LGVTFSGLPPSCSLSPTRAFEWFSVMVVHQNALRSVEYSPSIRSTFSGVLWGFSLMMVYQNALRSVESCALFRKGALGGSFGRRRLRCTRDLAWASSCCLYPTPQLGFRRVSLSPSVQCTAQLNGVGACVWHVPCRSQPTLQHSTCLRLQLRRIWPVVCATIIIKVAWSSYTSIVKWEPYLLVSSIVAFLYALQISFAAALSQIANRWLSMFRGSLPHALPPAHHSC